MLYSQDLVCSVAKSFEMVSSRLDRFPLFIFLIADSPFHAIIGGTSSGMFVLLQFGRCNIILSRMLLFMPLRSTDKQLLVVPRSKLKRHGDRPFNVVEPVLWNSLPEYMKSSSYVAYFKRTLNTFLFRQEYGVIN